MEHALSHIKPGKFVRIEDWKEFQNPEYISKEWKDIPLVVKSVGFDHWSNTSYMYLGIPGFEKATSYVAAILKPKIKEPKIKVFEVLPKEEQDILDGILPQLAGLVMPVGTQSTGTDPEIFVTVPCKGKQMIMPAFEWLPDKKTVRGYVPFWDGFQAEFTVEPGSCHAYLVDRIQRGLQLTLEAAKKHNSKATLNPSDVLDIPIMMLQSASDEHVALGCAPSKNIYGTRSIMGTEGRTLGWRTAGFHVHHGKNLELRNPDPSKIIEIVDAFAGVVMTSVLQGLEDSRRRKLYGRAGEYRTPSYGYEYRTLGSTVLWSPAITHLALDLVRTGFQLGELGWSKIWTYNPEQVQNAINDYDIPECKKIIQANMPILHAWFKRRYGFSRQTHLDRFDEVVLKGIGQFIDLDCVSNWHLKSTQTWKLHSASANSCFTTFISNMK